MYLLRSIHRNLISRKSGSGFWCRHTVCCLSSDHVDVFISKRSFTSPWGPPNLQHPAKASSALLLPATAPSPLSAVAPSQLHLPLAPPYLSEHAGREAVEQACVVQPPQGRVVQHRPEHDIVGAEQRVLQLWGGKGRKET